MKKIVLSALAMMSLVACGNKPAASTAAATENSNEELRCYAEAKQMADALSAAAGRKIAFLKLESETEVVNYTLHLEGLSFDYELELDNDSASACLPLEVRVVRPSEVSGLGFQDAEGLAEKLDKIVTEGIASNASFATKVVSAEEIQGNNMVVKTFAADANKLREIVGQCLILKDYAYGNPNDQEKAEIIEKIATTLEEGKLKQARSYSTINRFFPVDVLGGDCDIGIEVDGKVMVIGAADVD